MPASALEPNAEATASLFLRAECDAFRSVCALRAALPVASRPRRAHRSSAAAAAPTVERDCYSTCQTSELELELNWLALECSFEVPAAHLRYRMCDVGESSVVGAERRAASSLLLCTSPRVALFVVRAMIRRCTMSYSRSRSRGAHQRVRRGPLGHRVHLLYSPALSSAPRATHSTLGRHCSRVSFMSPLALPRAPRALASPPLPALRALECSEQAAADIFRCRLSRHLQSVPI